MKDDEGSLIIRGLKVKKTQRVETETEDDVKVAHKTVLEGSFGRVTIVTLEEQDFVATEDVEVVVLRPQTKITAHTSTEEDEESDLETV